MSSQIVNDMTIGVVLTWRQSAHGAEEHLYPGQPRRQPFMVISLGSLHLTSNMRAACGDEALRQCTWP